MPNDADPVANIREGGDHQRRDEKRGDAGHELHPPLSMDRPRREGASDEPLARVGKVAQLRLLIGERLMNLGAQLVHLGFLLEETWPQTVTGSIDSSLCRRRRNTQRDADLLNREVEVEMQEEGLAIAVRQPRYGSRQVDVLDRRLSVTVRLDDLLRPDE